MKYIIVNIIKNNNIMNNYHLPIIQRPQPRPPKNYENITNYEQIEWLHKMNIILNNKNLTKMFTKIINNNENRKFIY